MTSNDGIDCTAACSKDCEHLETVNCALYVMYFCLKYRRTIWPVGSDEDFQRREQCIADMESNRLDGRQIET